MPAVQIIRYISFYFGFFASFFTSAMMLQPQVLPDHNKTIVVAASAYLPPYVMAKSNSGYQLDVLKAAFASEGFTKIEVKYLSNKRVESLLDAGLIDVALNYPADLRCQVYKSDNLLNYQNVAISLKSKHLRINTIYDLLGKSVIAFQNSKAYLEPPYADVVDKLTSYDEVVNQAAQVDHLLKGWVDVVVIEKRIFEFYLRQYDSNIPLSHFAIHEIFQVAPRPAFFKNKELADVFDRGLADIKKNGRYQAIMSLDVQQYVSFSDLAL